MACEIEREFLVQGDGWRVGTRQRLRQCYLNRDKERTVRVRIAGAATFRRHEAGVAFPAVKQILQRGSVDGNQTAVHREGHGQGRTQWSFAG